MAWGPPTHTPHWCWDRRLAVQSGPPTPLPRQGRTSKQSRLAEHPQTVPLQRGGGTADCVTWAEDSMLGVGAVSVDEASDTIAAGQELGAGDAAGGVASVWAGVAAGSCKIVCAMADMYVAWADERAWAPTCAIAWLHIRRLAAISASEGRGRKRMASWPSKVNTSCNWLPSKPSFFKMSRPRSKAKLSSAPNPRSIAWVTRCWNRCWMGWFFNRTSHARRAHTMQ